MKTAATVILTIILIGTLGCGLGTVSWKGDEGNHYYAVGTILWKGEAVVPGSRDSHGNAHNFYLQVNFETDDKTTFVIPFRQDDMEAIPVRTVDHIEDSGGTTGFNCELNGVCTAQAPSPVTHTKVLGDPAHGVLQYHNCDGFLMCFDSFTRLK
jgi:hypothetical protein